MSENEVARDVELSEPNLEKQVRDLRSEVERLTREREKCQSDRDTDWVLAIADAVGADSGLNIPIVPESKAIKRFLDEYTKREVERLKVDDQSLRGTPRIDLSDLEYCDACDGKESECSKCGGQGVIFKDQPHAANSAERSHRRFPNGSFSVDVGESKPDLPAAIDAAHEESRKEAEDDS